MPYCEINKHPVFLSHQRYERLNGLALADKGSVFAVASSIAGFPEAREADRMRFRYLTALSKQDPEGFYREWVEFDLRGQEAADNAWDLLYDYCAFRHIGYLMDLRSEIGSIVADYGGDSAANPMGRIFGLRVSTGHTLASFFHLRRRSKVTVIVDTSQAVRAYGILAGFRIEFRHWAFDCRKEFSVVLINQG